MRGSSDGASAGPGSGVNSPWIRLFLPRAKLRGGAGHVDPPDAVGRLADHGDGLVAARLSRRRSQGAACARSARAGSRGRASRSPLSRAGRIIGGVDRAAVGKDVLLEERIPLRGPPLQPIEPRRRGRRPTLGRSHG